MLSHYLDILSGKKSSTFNTVPITSQVDLQKGLQAFVNQKYAVSEQEKHISDNFAYHQQVQMSSASTQYKNAQQQKEKLEQAANDQNCKQYLIKFIDELKPSLIEPLFILTDHQLKEVATYFFKSLKNPDKDIHLQC